MCFFFTFGLKTRGIFKRYYVSGFFLNKLNTAYVVVTESAPMSNKSVSFMSVKRRWRQRQRCCTILSVFQESLITLAFKGPRSK